MPNGFVNYLESIRVQVSLIGRRESHPVISMSSRSDLSGLFLSLPWYDTPPGNQSVLPCCHYHSTSKAGMRCLLYHKFSEDIKGPLLKCLLRYSSGGFSLQGEPSKTCSERWCGRGNGVAVGVGIFTSRNMRLNPHFSGAFSRPFHFYYVIYLYTQKDKSRGKVAFDGPKYVLASQNLSSTFTSTSTYYISIPSTKKIILTPYTSHSPYPTLLFPPLPLPYLLPPFLLPLFLFPPFLLSPFLLPPFLLPPFLFFKALLQNRDQIVQSSYPQARMGMPTQGGVFVGVGEEKNGGGAGTEASGHIVKGIANLLVKYERYERETVRKGGRGEG